MPLIENPDEMDHAYAAHCRYLSMLDLTHISDASDRLAEEDRRDHAAIYAPEAINPQVKTVYSAMLCLRFMVEICGITYEAAEKMILADLMAFGTGEDCVFAPVEGATAETIAGDFMKALGAVEALFQARLYNEAAKGSPWASFWNEVVRMIRTRRFAPLNSGIFIDDE